LFAHETIRQHPTPRKILIHPHERPQFLLLIRLEHQSPVHHPADAVIQYRPGRMRSHRHNPTSASHNATSLPTPAGERKKNPYIGNVPLYFVRSGTWPGNGASRYSNFRPAPPVPVPRPQPFTLSAFRCRPFAVGLSLSAFHACNGGPSRHIVNSSEPRTIILHMAIPRV